MSYQATVYRVLVASPSDVSEERRAIPEIVHQWNRDNALLLKTVLETVKWETHCTPEMGDRPQEIVNRQIVRDCDILVGVFWTRLGSPTGKEESGSVEEIREFIAKGKPVLLYFSKVPVVPDSLDEMQWNKLKAFRNECQEKGIVYAYESVEKLRELLRSHLGRTIQKLNSTDQNRAAASSSPPPDEETAQKIALRSFNNDFRAFLRKASAAWAAERDSEPISTEEAKFVLSGIADDLLEFRSRITSDSGQPSTLLAEVAKRIKSLQRHQVYLDGGVSFGEFWEEGDQILFLLEIVPALLDDALQDEGTIQARRSTIRAAIEELEFNQRQLAAQEYSTAMILRTQHSEALIGARLQLPEQLLTSLRTHIQNVQAARDVHRTTTSGAGDSTPELIKIEDLLNSARYSAEAAIRGLTWFCQYRYEDKPESAAGVPAGGSKR